MIPRRNLNSEGEMKAAAHTMSLVRLRRTHIPAEEPEVEVDTIAIP